MDHLYKDLLRIQARYTEVSIDQSPCIPAPFEFCPHADIHHCPAPILFHQPNILRVGLKQENAVVPCKDLLVVVVVDLGGKAACLNQPPLLAVGIIH